MIHALVSRPRFEACTVVVVYVCMMFSDGAQNFVRSKITVCPAMRCLSTMELCITVSCLLQCYLHCILVVPLYYGIVSS